MRNVIEAKPIGLRITNEFNPKIELINENAVFIGDERLNGVIDYNFKSSEFGSELLIRLNVLPMTTL